MTYLAADLLDLYARIGWGVVLTGVVLASLWVLIEAARARDVIRQAPGTQDAALDLDSSVSEWSGKDHA